MPETVTPEAAVRLYLLWLEDPAKLVDEVSLRRAETAVENAKDPLDRLHALADLEHARQADGDQVQRDFVTHAKGYAEAQTIPVSAFEEMGVPREVLAEAGFEVGRRGGRGRGRSASTARSSGRQRAQRVPLEDIKGVVTSQMSKRFTLSELGEKAGGSPATLRKAVDDLIEAGKVKKIGPQEGYSGRGRAPTEYELR